MIPAQLRSHLGEQRIVGGLGQVSHCRSRAIAPSSRRAAGNHRDTPLPAVGNESYLVSDIVDRIHNIIKAVR